MLRPIYKVYIYNGKPNLDQWGNRVTSAVVRLFVTNSANISRCVTYAAESDTRGYVNIVLFNALDDTLIFDEHLPAKTCACIFNYVSDLPLPTTDRRYKLVSDTFDLIMKRQY